MLAVLVCEKTGWTYTEYQDQPVWFVQAMLAKWGADADYQKRQSKT